MICGGDLCMCLPEEIYNGFSFLRNMFSNEFILCPGATVQVRHIFSVLVYSRLIMNKLLYGHCDIFLSPPVVWQDFEEACYLLVKTGALQINQQEVLITERGHRTLAFLTSVLDPFLQGYQVRKMHTQRHSVVLNTSWLDRILHVTGWKSQSCIMMSSA